MGYGHKIQPGEDFSAGLTQAEARALLRQDVRRFEDKVRKRVKRPLTQSQFDALASLAFNLRDEAFTEEKSTLLRELNAGNYDAAAELFLDYNKAAGRRQAGLDNRRVAERKLFRGETDGDDQR